VINIIFFNLFSVFLSLFTFFPFELPMCAVYVFQSTFAIDTIYGMPALFANHHGHGHKIRLEYDDYWKNISSVIDGDGD